MELAHIRESNVLLFGRLMKSMPGQNNIVHIFDCD